MSTSTNPVMPAFSYAQAAKGLAPSNSQSSVKEESSDRSPKASQKLEQKSDSVSSPSSTRKSSGRGRGDDKDALPTTKEASSATIQAADGPEKSSARPGRRTLSKSDEADLRTIGLANHPPSDDSKPTTENAVAAPADPRDSWAEASQIENGTENDNTTIDKDKVKDSEDDWEKVSVPSVAAEKEKELKAAPLPVVNIWKQRQEAQEAKRRAAATPAVPAQPAKPLQPADDSKRKSSGQGNEKEAVSMPRKSNDASKQNDRTEFSSSQSSRPASQHGDRRDSSALPPVADSMSWPTPENASTEDRRKSASQDKPEVKPGAKSHGKQWVAMPFVPTAKFQTPLPNAAAKRGGRLGRGRDGTGRGGHGGGASRIEANAPMGPPPPPRQATEQDRGRNPEGSRGARASSVPAATKRPSSRESTMTNLRKPSAPSKHASGTHSPTPASSTPAGETSQGRGQDSEIDTPSRSSSRKGAQATEMADPAATRLENAAEGANVGTNDTSTRAAYPTDRHRTAHASNRPAFDSTRERGPGRNRDWSREKSEAAREKVESWRDRDLSGEAGSRREPRPDRSRGTYRGRGNPAYGSYSGSHAYTSPLPQNGFETAKPSYPGDSRSRQTSQPFSISGQTPPGRNNPRSQSIPVGMMYPNYFGSPSNMSQIPPIGTDMSAYGFNPQMTMHGGIMSAMPYQEPLNSYAVMSMIMSQVEYYFSIDNLCKDMYLRKNMDSQGFVPLSVIANFKRIRALTEENGVDVLRQACQSLVKQLEYVPGSDGTEDRLRRRYGWQDFVLPMSERLPAAQTDGPIVKPEAVQMEANSSQPPPETAFTQEPIRSPISSVAPVNGLYNTTPSPSYGLNPPLDGSASDYSSRMAHASHPQEQYRRDTAISPFSTEQARPSPPSSKPRSGAGPMNGHHRQGSRSLIEENIFPDEEIANINICVRDAPMIDNVGDQAPLTPIERLLSNDSRGSGLEMQAANIPPRVSGLRGGGGNPEQLSRLQGMTFGSSAEQQDSDVPTFFTKHGQPTRMPAAQPGQYFVPYLHLHDDALEQRNQGIEGAMTPMYSFWSTFLVDKFNNGMYQEFKNLAAMDSMAGDNTGMEYLMTYYQNALRTTTSPLADPVTGDLVQMLRQETQAARPIFSLLKMAWRNGATNLKTRKRIGDQLTAEEKEEFEKGG